MHTATSGIRPVAFTCLLVLLGPRAGAATAESTQPSPAPATQSGLRDALRIRIDKVLADKRLNKSQVSVHVMALPDGAELYSRHADRPMIPASNVKLVTTAAALDLLGPEWHFQTHVAVRGNDLVLIGGGDPTISARFAEGGDPGKVFDQWIAQLKQRGLKRIAGDLVVDDGYFDDQFIHPSWPRNQLHRWYCAPVCALSLNDNCIDVHVTPGEKAGDPVDIRLVPASDYAQVTNELKTVEDDKLHEWLLLRAPGSSDLICRGRISRADQSEMTVVDPAMFFGATFAEALKRNGIPLDGKLRRQRGAADDPDLRIVLTHRTPLTTALVVANKRSQGFYCEQLVKVLGAETNHAEAPGSWANGRAAIAGFLAKLGIGPDTYVLDDGSGLSRKNRFTARQFTTLLTHMHRHPHREVFQGSLAIAGVDGTLRRRMTDPDVRGRIFAKTGYIAGVRTLSGYVWTDRRRWLAFSILGNAIGSHGKVVANRICDILQADEP